MLLHRVSPRRQAGRRLDMTRRDIMVQRRWKSQEGESDENGCVQAAGLVVGNGGAGGDRGSDAWRGAHGVVCANGDEGPTNEFDWQHGPSTVADRKIRGQDAGIEADRHQFGDGGPIEDAAGNQRRLRAEDRRGPSVSSEDGFSAQEHRSASDLQQDCRHGDRQADGGAEAKSDDAKRASEIMQKQPPRSTRTRATFFTARVPRAPEARVGNPGLFARMKTGGRTPSANSLGMTGRLTHD